MADKVYVVTLKKYEDLDGFYSDMSSDGYKLHMKRPISRNTQYYMTAEQAEEIKKDARVLDVELNLEDAGLVPTPFALQNNTPYNATGTYRKNNSFSTYTATDLDWGKIHCAGNDADRGKGTFGTDGTTSKTATANVFNDGKHVDVVICDNQVSTDCGEWDDGNGNSRFKDYDWYTQHNAQVASIDDDGASIPSAPYNNYWGNATNETYHGTHVAGTLAGKTYGWAKQANIYSMQVLGNGGNQGTPVPTNLMFDYLRAFHRYKAINPTTGRRNPTITNHSWGLIITLESWGINDITQIRWRGGTYASTSGFNNPSGWTLNGINADFGLEPGKNPLPGHSSSLNADVEDAIADGVVVIGAVGNMNCYMVPEYNPDGTQHQDWDNYVWFNNQSPNIKYFCRGSSPNCAQGVISVGNLSDYKNFRRATSSNYGPNIDVFAPGDQTVSCFGKAGVIKDTDGNVINGLGATDTKYGGDNFFYTLTGTSMASPQVAGIAACLATNKERFTNSDVLGYIQKHSKVGDMTFDVGPTSGQSYYSFDVNAFNNGEYTITGTDQNGAVSGGNPTITCSVHDQITFKVPPQSSVYVAITNASNAGYAISWSDRTHWHTGNGLGNSSSLTAGQIQIEVGDKVDLGVQTDISNHPIYIKTAPTTGSGDQVTTGTTYGQGTTSLDGAGWDTSTGPTVVPGTYYVRCGNHAMGFQIIVHAAGTYYNHPFYIKTQQGGGTANQVTGATGQGSNNFNVTGNVVWSPTANGTYYYQCGNHGGMNGQIVVNAVQGALGQNGNFADPTCQKDSPNRYILAVNPRPTSGVIKETLGERISEQKTGESRQMFPRTKTIYGQT